LYIKPVITSIQPYIPVGRPKKWRYQPSPYLINVVVGEGSAEKTASSSQEETEESSTAVQDGKEYAEMPWATTPQARTKWRVRRRKNRA